MHAELAPGDEGYDHYERCFELLEAVSPSPGPAPADLPAPGDPAWRRLFDHLLDCGVHALRRAALTNVHCPPQRLERHVQEYLGRPLPASDPLIDYAVANPSLPTTAMRQVVDRLLSVEDPDVLGGILRNPRVPASLLRNLLAAPGVASGPNGESSRADVRFALWCWHDETM
jgi:hypothetical protein